jgi:hypothetical protein
MLQTEGYLGRISEIESPLFCIYRQQVWFRGGLPQKGSHAYLKSWQIAAGLNRNGARLLDGQEIRKYVKTLGVSKALDNIGLHITEISQLQEIFQWKSMPFLDSRDCFQKIRRIALDEYRDV